MRGQLREQLGKPRRDGPYRCSLFGGVLWITRRQAQLESEPCEAVRCNPSRQHGSTGSGRAEIVKGEDQTQGWVSSSDEHADGRDAQRSDSCIRGERCGSRCVHFQKPDVLKLDPCPRPMEPSAKSVRQMSTETPLPQSSAGIPEQVIGDDPRKQLELSVHRYENGEWKYEFKMSSFTMTILNLLFTEAE